MGLLIALLLLSPRPAVAQASNPPDAPASVPAAAPTPSQVQAQKNTVRQENATKKTQIADLNAQEKRAMDAVTADTTLSKSDSNAAKRKIHADFKARKDAIRAQMKIGRKAKHADVLNFRAARP